MKKVLLFPFLSVQLLALPLITNAQSDPLPKIDGDFGYQKIVEVPGKDVATILTKSKSAIVKIFNNTNNGTVQEDKESGKLIMKATTPVTVTWMLASYLYDIKYVVDFTAKEGKYRIQLNNLDIKPGRGNKMPYKTIQQIIDLSQKGATKKIHKDLLKKTDEILREELDQIETSINKEFSDNF